MMVFETVVLNVLNKYLGDYVENLDRTQLRLGIWRGNVVLKNLILKQNALDDLHLPIKTISGFLGMLTLKIPWKNLYGASFEATVKNCFLLVVPNFEIKYDEIKEEVWKQEAKQAIINRIEAAKKTEKDQPPSDDTFLEKLVTHIVRNVEISIKNIHIRYEDRVSNPGKPFAFGVTLSSLLVTTTGDNWQSRVSDDLSALIYKILSIDSLSVYWNSKTLSSFLQLPHSKLIRAFQEGIGTRDTFLKNYHFIFGPINTVCRLRINSKPERDGFTIPKLLLNLEFEKLQARINKFQFQDLIILLDGIDRMATAAPYRKYRPPINTYKGYYSQWWKFAYQCIVEEDIRRRKRNWDWSHIYAHRQTCKEYAKAYEQKLLSPSSSVEKTCQKYENVLDVLNIVLVRQKVELELERKGHLDQQKQTQGGWFSSWTGIFSKHNDQVENEIKHEFQEAMSHLEKQKLYQAIDYQENAALPQYPIQFVGLLLNIFLGSLEFEINYKSSLLLTGTVKNFIAMYEERPSGQAIKCTVTMNELLILGMRQGDILPKLVQSNINSDLTSLSFHDFQESFLNILVEINPPDGECDQRVNIRSRPILFIYDAVTINQVVNVFTVKRSTFLTHVHTAAYIKLEELKEKTALGLQYAIEQHTKICIEVDIMGFYGIFSDSGLYTSMDQALLVVYLGRILLNSKLRPKKDLTVQEMHKQGTSELEIMKELISRSYDRFVLEIRHAQVQMILPGESWKIEKAGKLEQYIIHPINLKVNLAKRIFTDNPTLPKIKIFGMLPSINITVSETRLFYVASLISSVPLPDRSKSKHESEQEFYISPLYNRISLVNLSTSTNILQNKKSHSQPKDEFIQFIEFEAVFELREVSINVFQNTKSQYEKPLGDFHMLVLEVNVIKRTNDININMKLGGLSLLQDFQEQKLNVVSSPMAKGEKEYLIIVNFFNVDPNSPELYSKHQSIAQQLEVVFTRLDVMVHQEAFLYALNWIKRMQKIVGMITVKLSEGLFSLKKTTTPTKSDYLRPTITNKGPSSTILFKELKRGIKTNQEKKNEPAIEDKIILMLQGHLKKISLTFRNNLYLVGAIHIDGVNTTVIMKQLSTEIDAKLCNFEFIDLRANTNYPKVLSIFEGEEVFTAKVLLFDVAKHWNDNYINMSVTATISRIRLVFLSSYLRSIVDFLGEFSTAQQRILEISAAAVESATENVQQGYKQAFRVLFNIKLNAPIILIPANYMSRDAVLIDLGVLSLVNNFQTSNSNVDNNEMTAVIDCIHADMQNLKVYRVNQDLSMNVVNESLLVQPISFNVIIQRNVSVDCFTVCPYLDVSGYLDSIHVTLAQEDYKMVITILSQNFEEKLLSTYSIKLTETNESLNLNSLTKLETSGEFNNFGLKNRTLDSKMALSTQTLFSVHTLSKTGNNSVKVSFKMTSFILDLYKSVDTRMSVDIQPAFGLARFTLCELSINFSMMLDSSLNVTLVLKNCLIDDTRITQVGKICRYMERKSSINTNGKMINITFNRQGQKNIVNMKVHSFILILNLEHLLKIVEFFISGLNNAEINTHYYRKRYTRGSHVSIIRSALSVSLDVLPENTITVMLKVEQPDIIIVENMDDINTSAIIINNEIDFRLKKIRNHYFVSGSLKNFQLFSCCFNPERRQETKAPILRPITVHVVGSTPTGQGLHVDINTTSIHLAVSPGTIELLYRVTSKITETETEFPIEKEQESDYSFIWNIEALGDEKCWYLQNQLKKDTTEIMSVEQQEIAQNEICLLSVPSLVVTLEAGVGSKTLPMLLFHSNLRAEIYNWNSILTINCILPVQISYYNSHLALWEPFLEPMEIVKVPGNVIFVPFEVSFLMELRGFESQGKVNMSEDQLNILNMKPKMSVIISSSTTMEMTLTKTCLDVLIGLKTAFNNALFNPEIKTKFLLPAYIVQNELGLPVTLKLIKGVFKVYDEDVIEDKVKDLVLISGSSVGLCLIEKEDVKPMTGGASIVKEKYLHIELPEYQSKLYLPVARADKRFYFLDRRNSINNNRGMVCDVQVQDGTTFITLRTVIQIQNKLDLILNVFIITEDNEIEIVGSISPNKQFNLPLRAIYTPTNKLYFNVEGYALSNPLVWKDFQTSLTKEILLQCHEKYSQHMEPYFIKAIGEVKQIYFELSNRHSMASTCYKIILIPNFMIRNFLPVDVILFSQCNVAERYLTPGQSMAIPTAVPGVSSIVIRISGYLEREWSCKNEILTNPQELSVWTFHSYDGVQHVTLDLGMHCINKNGSLMFSLYCPFWMINRTGLMLSYKKSNKADIEGYVLNHDKRSGQDSNVLFHPGNFKGPIMYSFGGKKFFGRKISFLRVNDGEWSEKFSLDAAGSYGVVKCKVDDIVYNIGVHIHLTKNSLTKQVIFTPYYVIVNQCRLAVEAQEVEQQSNSWIMIQPGHVSEFWPKKNVNDRKQAQLVIRLINTLETTVPFTYEYTKSFLLKLRNRYGAVKVDILKTDGAIYITFNLYSPGMAPALIINHSPYDVPLGEKDTKDNFQILSSGNKVMFNWSTSKEGYITWCDQYTNSLRKDDKGEFNINPNITLYWVTFLDGMQRVLLFTADNSIVSSIETASEMEVVDKEILIFIEGLGLSLVDNVTQKEILYLSIKSSGAIWESRKSKGKKYKTISSDDTLKIEEAFNRYIQALENNRQINSKFAITHNLLVDFETNEMLKPHHRQLRRTYNNGVWLQLKFSKHQYQIYAKANAVQIDNQSYNCVFPVVFAPTSSLLNINMENPMKAFAEVCIVQRKNEYSSVRQYKYFKVLIQEFNVMIDIGFVNSLLNLLKADSITEDQAEDYFVADCDIVNESLVAHFTLQSFQEKKNFYEILHLSPLKIHFSFSLSGGSTQSQPQSIPPLLSVLIKSLGVTFTDIQDVVIKLSFFERSYTFMTEKQLTTEVQIHYLRQLIKQIYVLMFGLDVLGNPFGLVVGIKEGVQDLFYEPLRGAIQGPEEFAEGMVLGVRSLFGHTVGGAAGALSRITGVMGKGIAALTFDEEYQRKRREAMNYRSINPREALAQSGQGIVMGVVDGISGVVNNPIRGAREEGVEGFCKGLGKGVVGLVTRPAVGVVDFASDSLGAVKRLTQSGKEITRIRIPRFFNPDKVLRPYCKIEAYGNKLLKHLDKGKYYATDVYVYHTHVGPVQCRDILLLTNNRLLLLTHNVFGGIQVEFSHIWRELAQIPCIHPKGIEIEITKSKNNIRILPSRNKFKLVFLEDEELKKYVVEKIFNLMNAASVSTSS